MGASYQPEYNAVNFAIFSGSATKMSLVLFNEGDLQAGRVTAEIPLDPAVNRSGDVWHIMVPNMQPGLLYGFRVWGFHQDKPPPPTPKPAVEAPPTSAVAPPEPFAPDGPPAGPPSSAQEETPAVIIAGHRFDDSKVVVDPYAKLVISRRQYGQLAPELPYGKGEVLGLARTWPQAAAVVPGPESVTESFDWEGDKPLGLPMEQLVIYEMHVRGFTRADNSGASAPGTYKGMVEKLDYLQCLGVNAVELLPMQEFNELEYYAQIPGSQEYRFNFWGYSTANFFAPMTRFSDAASKGKSGLEIQNEFKTLVKEAHRRGIEVILDVVFNHTAEGNEKGPTLSFRGLDNRVYYVLAPGGEYYNYSGCGNTMNCNHPVVRTFILDCLRYWVTEYHVDGFRFDLASILTRAHSAWHRQELDDSGNLIPGPSGIIPDAAGCPTGTPLSDPALIEMISDDPILRGTKMIAEAWDCDGLYQVGAFPHYGGRWAEWNGKFRDTVRNFIKGTDGPWAGNFAAALCGSPDIYANNTPPEDNWWANNAGRKWWGNRTPIASVNFITAHDGFTLSDVVSYNEKHNESNGEDNRDGENHNLSWNCGEEGPTGAWNVMRLRQRQMRNLFSALLLSSGVPMFHMGDEYGHTKNGNNNTYCHDSPVNWLDWDAAKADSDGFARFSRLMVKLRRSSPVLQKTQYVNEGDIQWHGEEPHVPDWTDQSRLVAYTLYDPSNGGGYYVAFNAAHIPKVLKLPKTGGRMWRPLVDTGKQAPYDFLVADEELSQADVDRARASQAMWMTDFTVPVMPYSVVILESVPDGWINCSLRAAPAKEPRWNKPGDLGLRFESSQ